MATEISGVTKDAKGRTTHVCGPDLARTDVATLMVAIQLGAKFYVDVGGFQANVEIVNARSGPYLRTDRDTTTRNNLDYLGPC